ncbi:MAG: adenylate/guanylate cyclase domain-containing protein [Anaerolineae bacterium]
MPDSLALQIQQLETAIATLHAQRAILGEAVVDTALASLKEQLATLDAQRASQAGHVQERRLLTILFADVVGSTALAEKMDPEEWHQVISRLHTAIGDIISRHQGMISQYLGDGLLALFGAQQPSEFDAENAIRAALEIQAQAGHPKELSDTGNLRPATGDLQLRVGIHTGLVITGEIGTDTHKEFTATGDAMNLAARLQTSAPPGGVLISYDSYTHVRGLFDVMLQPPLTIKGKSEPVQTYLVTRARPRLFQTVTRGVAGVQTRTVGREYEFSLLQSAYQEANDLRQWIWAQLIGEPGMGKSRLMEEMRVWITTRAEPVELLRARAFIGDAAQPFALVRRFWFDRFGIAEDMPLAEAQARWVTRFEELWRAGNLQSAEESQELAHALGLLVGLPFLDSPYIGAMRNDPVQVKGRAFVVSRELLSRLRQAGPVVLLLEDLHWIDAASWEYLEAVVLEMERAGDNGLFVLATVRPEWLIPPALERTPGFRPVKLTALAPESSRQLVRLLLAHVQGLPDELVQVIVERSDGVPYFAEELVNLFLDRGVIDARSEPWRYVPGRLDAAQLPQTLQQLLLTRLLALPPAQRTYLQHGAIYGRQFWEGGLAAMGLTDSSHLLPPLQPRGLVEPAQVSSFQEEREWSFHHALLQQVTYESVLKRERPQLHRAAAGWLEDQARRAERLDEFAGLIGEHRERAGELAVAAEWYLVAGERAQAASALPQARHYFDRALDLLPVNALPRRWQAMQGREAVLHLLGERQAQKTDIAALLELAERLNEDALRAEAFWRQERFATATGDYRTTLSAADAAIAAAARANSPGIELRARAERVVGLTRSGDTLAAQQAAEETLARTGEIDDQAARAYALWRVAFYLFGSGDRARAAELGRQSAELAQRLGDRALEAAALGNVAAAYAFLGLYQEARTSIEQALPMCEAIGDRRQRAYHLLNLGMVYFWSGDVQTARRLELEAFAELTAVGDVIALAANQLYLGYVLEQEAEWVGAAAHYREAQTVFAGVGAIPFEIEAQAGEARCAWALGQWVEARQLVAGVWDYMSARGGAALESPSRVYQSVADITAAAGDIEISRAAVQAGYRELMASADRIGVPEWRKSFLENVPEHRALVERWQQLA